MNSANREVSTKHILIPVFAVLTIILLDQLTKALALKFLPTVCNIGFAFGLGQTAVSGYVSFLALLVVGYFLFKNVRSDSFSYKIFALSLIVGGGLSNLFDRLIRRCVVDFVDLKIWPSFNLADTAISCGVVVLIFLLVKETIYNK